MAVRCNTSRLKSWRTMQFSVVLSSVWHKSNTFVTRHRVMCLYVEFMWLMLEVDQRYAELWVCIAVSRTDS